MFEKVLERAEELAGEHFAQCSRAAAVAAALGAAALPSSAAAAQQSGAPVPNLTVPGQIAAPSRPQIELAQSLAQMGFKLPESRLTPYAAQDLNCVTAQYDSLPASHVVPWIVPDGTRVVIGTIFDNRDPSDMMGDVAVKMVMDMARPSDWRIDVLYDQEDDGADDARARILGPTCSTNWSVIPTDPIIFSSNASSTLGDCGSTGPTPAGCDRSYEPLSNISGRPRGGVFRIAVTDTVPNGIAGTVNEIVWYVARPQVVSVEPSAPHSSDHLSAWPNPFFSRAEINFTLPREQAISLELLDAQGRLIRQLAHGTYPAGVHALTWDGQDSDARKVGPGMYFLRLSTPEAQEVERIAKIGGR